MGFDSNTGGGGGGTRGRGRMTYAERERRIKKNTQGKRDRERKRRREHDDLGEGTQRGYGTKGDKRGSGIRVSSFDPLSLLLVPPSPPYPVLASIRTSPSLSPWRARAPFSPTPGLTAWRATIAIAKPPLSGRLVPLPYLGAPTARGDSGASQRASLRSRHGDVTLSSVVQ